MTAGAAGDGTACLAPHWRCGDVLLDLGRTRVMGVVNVTPDSFSDGGAHSTTEAAVAWGMRLLDEGADILDVGGESTRPGFAPVDPDEERRRVVPVVAALAEAGALVSVDTRHAEVASAALASGARIVNDVSGFGDPAMVAVAAASSCGCVVMHAGSHLAPAASRAASPRDVVSEVEAYLLRQGEALQAAGVSPDRICIDPGPGFDKTADEDVALQRATGRLSRLGFPYLCAPSRKRFVGATSGVRAASDRDAATCGVCLAAAARGARVVRVHNVAAVSEALRCFEAVGEGPERRALVALGANMGDRLATLRDALDDVDALPLTRVLRASHAYQSVPAYLDDQPVFANAVALVSTRLHPLALLDQLLGVEDAHGRVRVLANGPRSLDLDLLWMEGERHAGRRLALPHPLMGERDFVLRPLEDVTGDAVAFCEREGIEALPRERRVGLVTDDLGSLGFDATAGDSMPANVTLAEVMTEAACDYAGEGGGR